MITPWILLLVEMVYTQRKCRQFSALMVQQEQLECLWRGSTQNVGFFLLIVSGFCVCYCWPLLVDYVIDVLVSFHCMLSVLKVKQRS